MISVLLLAQWFWLHQLILLSILLCVFWLRSRRLFSLLRTARLQLAYDEVGLVRSLLMVDGSLMSRRSVQVGDLVEVGVNGGADLQEQGPVLQGTRTCCSGWN